MRAGAIAIFLGSMLALGHEGDVMLSMLLGKKNVRESGMGW